MIQLSQTITSIEIAKISGKSHKNVMSSIREMEGAWLKIGRLKFQLTSYKDYSLPNLFSHFIAS